MGDAVAAGPGPGTGCCWNRNHFKKGGSGESEQEKAKEKEKTAKTSGFVNSLIKWAWLTLSLSLSLTLSLTACKQEFNFKDYAMSEDAITTASPAATPPANAHPLISPHHRLPLMTLAGSNLCLSKANNAVNDVHDDNSFRPAQCALPPASPPPPPSAQPSSQTLN